MKDLPFYELVMGKHLAEIPYIDLLAGFYSISGKIWTGMPLALIRQEYQR